MAKWAACFMPEKTDGVVAMLRWKPKALMHVTGTQKGHVI